MQRYFLFLFIFLFFFRLSLFSSTDSPYPLWVDFERVLEDKGYFAERKMDFSLPLVLGDVRYRVHYERAKNGGKIQRVLLCKEGEGEGEGKNKQEPTEVALFFWEKIDGAVRLKEFRHEKSGGKVLLVQKLEYKKNGFFVSKITDASGQIPVKRVYVYRKNGALCVEKIKIKNVSKVVRKWGLDGALVCEKKVTKTFDKTLKEKLIKREDGVFEKVCCAFENGKKSSRYRCEWKFNEKNKLEYIRHKPDNFFKKSRITSFRYDEQGRLTKKIKPDGMQIFYEYDLEGRLQRIFSQDETVQTEIGYDKNGYIAKVDDLHTGLLEREFAEDGTLASETINGSTITYAYDSEGRKSRITLPDKSAIQYDYDNKSKHIKITRLSSSLEPLYEQSTPYSSPKNEAQQVHYDEFGQIREETGLFCHDYTFDANGVLLTKDWSCFERNEYNEVTHDPQTNTRYEYDRNGNLIKKITNEHTYSFAYDALDRMTSAYKDEKCIASYTHDLFHRCITIQSKRHGQNKRHDFLYDGDEEIGCIENEKITELKICNPYTTHTAIIEHQDAAYRAETDARGSITALSFLYTNTHAFRAAYSAFGEEKIAQDAILSPWRFMGRRVSSETGLLHFGKRFYDRDICAFTTKDPYAFIDGMNGSAFIRNDPMRYIDPQGLFAEPLDFGAIYGNAKKHVSEFFTHALSTITFAQGKIGAFLDFRKTFEGVAFKVMNKAFWNLMGYNPDPSSVFMLGDQNIQDKVRVTMINGILNAQDGAVAAAEMVSQSHGNVPVHYLYSASAGFTADLLRSIFAKVGFVSREAQMLVNTWREAIREMGGPQGGGRIIHYAHSLGGLDTYRALEILSEEERKMIRIATFGSLHLISEDMCGGVTNFVSKKDAIPWFDPVRYIPGLFGAKKEIQFLDSDALPLCDHLLKGDTYKRTLEELGRTFQEEYLKKSLLSKGGSGSFSRPLPLHNVQAKIKRYLGKKAYAELGTFCAAHIDTLDALREIKKCIKRKKNTPFQRALFATNAILEQDQVLGLQPGELLQMALFIETKLKEHVSRRKYYLREHETGLCRAIEYDPATKKAFIHLETKGISLLGYGYHKKVTKSILYNYKAPEIVANCLTTHADEKEMQVMKALQGIEGIVEGHAFIKHEKSQNGEDGLEIILKYYNSQTLRQVYYDKIHKFTLQEKMNMAYDLLKGLSGMHKRGFVHRDLHTGNFLLDIRHNASAKERRVKIAITDFGEAVPRNGCQGAQPQCHRWYLAPEGFFFQRMKCDDYLYSDVYALGCVFYELLHEKDPEWFEDRYFANLYANDHIKWQDQKSLVNLMRATTCKRREELLQKEKTLGLSKEECFEALILRMMDPEPRVRGTTDELASEMRKILKKE